MGFDSVVPRDVIDMSKIVRLKKNKRHEYRVSLGWLLKNLPLEYWLWFITLLVAVFLLGIILGQIQWVRDLIEF